MDEYLRDTCDEGKALHRRDAAHAPMQWNAQGPGLVLGIGTQIRDKVKQNEWLEE